MGRSRVKKSDAPDAGGAQEIVTTSDAGGAQPIVVKDNIAALDRETGEHNCALSQLKQKGNIGIDYLRIRGHYINYKLIKLYKFLKI
jgi:hypothetical protein